jgi:hypothetical protein
MSSHDSATGSMDVERLSARPVMPKPKLVQAEMDLTPQPPSEPPKAAPELPVIIQREEVSDVLLAAFAALGFAVSARALVFLSLVGAFVLAVMAMMNQTMMSVVVLGLYCALTVLPLVFLELRAKRGDA